ncbi:aminotransferase class I/II-fold pyridoxal phosphate-dependent enzyme [Ancylobacter sp. 6x-1]|uniref:8-amino-7-oxononanoate synthase n=1 Tax=Ancylobacter crimeensis TaxID=2579147 RepID=A0ABT0DB58_9HYPH|nr:aminotransferase class I/II-fold pyridoxal phosphate-dependent enzyme [Ancylobacter crimeensis]MCK0196997.1 aminotransferase class I/II-fold pyridoxal phosphate-dependent enzyme [Ancylobacter crimeensis]
MMRSTSHGLPAEAREKLLARMRQTSRTPASAPAPQRYDISFETLPGYEDLQMMRAAGSALGLENPFFRAHDGCAGAVTSIAGKEVMNFASYDYLGLNAHPDVRRAAQQAIERFGTTVSASRLVAGERPFHRGLETRLAGVYRTEDALVFVSGHAANVTTIGSLLGPADTIFHDALIHNSIVVGAELAGARRRSFPHNDLDELERILATERPATGRALIVVEGLYSMDGDVPDLARLIALKERFGAWLMVDEAHALGVLGATGQGIAEHLGIDPSEVDIWMGTLSKSLASCGGYIAGRQPLIDWLRAKAPGFVYSVGLSPPAAAAALAALDAMETEPARIARLQSNSRHFLRAAEAAGLSTGHAAGHAIVPIMVGDSLKAVMMAERLLDRQINVLPIIPPAVPHKSARLRFFITAGHSAEQLDEAVRVVAEELDACTGIIATLGIDVQDDDDRAPMPERMRGVWS